MEFKILNPVVRPLPVDMMNDLLWIERPPDVEFHHHSVFTDAAVAVEALWKRVVAWRQHHDVALIGHVPTPVPPRGAASCDPIPCRLHLFRRQGRGAGSTFAVLPAHKFVSARLGAGSPDRGVRVSADEAGWRWSLHVQYLTRMEVQ